METRDEEKQTALDELWTAVSAYALECIHTDEKAHEALINAYCKIEDLIETGKGDDHNNQS